MTATPPSPGIPPDLPPELEESLRTALAPAYVLVRCLGAGGMGSVWLARDPVLRRSVAVKVLSPSLAAQPDARARFEREAQLVAALSHPNIVSIYAVGELPDRTPYFVMQFVSGGSLEARLATEHRLEIDEARRVVGEIASALAAAHAKGIIHRDIKPANVLFDEESRRTLVSDFGIAAVLPGAEARSTRLTQTGTTVGTPLYMSPEQLLAEPVTDRTDVYALGLVAFELIAGTPAFSGRTPQEVTAAHLRDPPRRLGELRKDADHEIESIVAACLSKTPEQRPAASEIATRLAPGGALLEWPPPGLAAQAGLLRPLSMTAGLGSGLLAGALVAMITISSTTLAEGVLLPILMACGLVGSAISIQFAVRLAQLVRDASRAVRAGYTWLTVAEVVSDRRRDTGSLISGAAEYSALSRNDRSRLRVMRIVRALAGLAAAVAPLPMGLLAIRVVDFSSAAAAMAILLPSLSLLLLASISARAETLAVGAARTAHANRRRAPDTWARLVDPWYRTFDATRGSQRPGRGARGRSRAGVIVGGLGVVAVLIVAVTFATAWLLGSTSSALFGSLALPTFYDIVQRVQRADGIRAYATPPDGSVSPQAAGEALHSISMMGGRARSDLRPATLTFPAFPSVTMPALQRVRDAIGGKIDSALMRPRGGFTSEERAYLAAVAQNPVWDAFDAVARATRADLVAARHDLPFPADLPPQMLAIPSSTTMREAASKNVARAAWHHASGRAAEADRVLRNGIAVGFRMVDDGNQLWDVVVGLSIVERSRDALEALYRATGDAREQTLRAYREAELIARRGRRWVRYASSTEILYVLLSDNTVPRGIRLEQLQTATIISCGSTRDLLFGPSPSHTYTIRTARAQLGRTPAEVALVDLYARRGETVLRASDGPRSLPERTWRSLATWSSVAASAVLGNNTIRNCTRMLLSYF